LTEARKQALRGELEALLGTRGVLSDPEELLVYESDGLTLFRALADFVVFPTSVEQVSRSSSSPIARECRSWRGERALGSPAGACRARAVS